MYGIIKFEVLFLLIGAHALSAANPEDIEFRARLVKGTPIYHMGEPIKVEISYSSQIEKKYYGSFSGPRPEFAGVTPQIAPTDGVLDLRELRRDRGFAGDILSALGYVGPQPTTQELDLCEWYRFQKPGHYSVTFTSTEASRVKSAEEGGGLEHLTLESNPVDFDILPTDPAWVAGEISNIEQQLNTAINPGERSAALRRLALMDTATSVQMLVRLYLASTHGGEDWIYDWALHDSSQTDIIIPFLLAALSDPAIDIPTGLPRLLADLQTRKELGVIRAYPGDQANQQKWNEERKARSKVHEKYLAQANALLTADIERRSGPQRAAAIYQVWYDATQLIATTPPALETLTRLQSNVLAVANDLDHDRQVQFLVLAWQTMPHEQLLPMIRKLAKDSLNHPPKYDDHEAFRLWCEGWPEDCSAAILRGVIDTNATMDRNVILMMSEAEHPELDKMLEAQLKDLVTLNDWGRLQRTAAVVLRAGSRNIVSAIDSFLDQSARSRGCVQEAQGDLIGYLFRVAPADGGNRLATALQATNNSCGTEILRTLHSERPSDDIIPIATKVLDSPNFAVAQSAALYLGDHGAASIKDALWQRLEALWSAWQGGSSESPHEVMSIGPGTKVQAAMLEHALASALAHARNWKLSPAELDHLHSGCLTQKCRDIADGKLFLNL